MALLILALLLTAVYGYWYLTNGSRIRRQARRYLRDITGAIVSIDRVSFSLFGDIRLSGVRLDVPGSRGVEPFFSASSVVLKHRPWSVFFGGSIKPTEIVSLDAEVTDSPATRAFMRARSLTASGAVGIWDLPVIRVGACRFKRIEVAGGITLPEKQFDLGVDMIPKDRRMIYDVYVAERKDTRVVQNYHIEVQLSPIFKGTIIEGAGDLVATGDALPPEYRKWLEDYQVAGRYSFEGPVSVSDSAVKGVLKLKLENVSFKLPKAQGGLSLSNVAGTLIFTPPDESRGDDLKNGRIELMKDVTGKVAEAGGATVRLSGVYRGYRLDSPFSVRIEIDKMALPKSSPHPELSEILELIHRNYSPVGRVDMGVNLNREAGKDRVSVNGAIRPLGISATYRFVPYRVDDVKGEITFDNKQVVINVTGKREGGTFTIDAMSPLRRDPETGECNWRVTVEVDSARMTAALAKALPKEAFIGKPYPLRGFKGRIRAVEGRVWIDQDDPLRARGPGDMRCAIHGQLTQLPKGMSVDIYVNADDVPVDRALTESLDQAGKDALGQLSPSGLVERLSLEVHDHPDKKTSYDIIAGLKDVSVTYKGFPYTLIGLRGDVIIQPGVIALKNLVGRHGKTSVTLQGKLYPGGKKVGVDLTVGAERLATDKELYRALPVDLKRIWDSLAPAGQADVALMLKQNLPGPGKKHDYRLEVRPKGMTATYNGFPYEFSGVTGLVTAEPGIVTLRKLKCDRDYQLDGEISDDGRKLKLKINALGVPFDKKLLAALPAEFKTVTDSVTPGGTLDVNLEDLTIIHGKADRSETQPATAPSAGAATRPSEKTGGGRWSARGILGLHDTTFNIAFGAKKLNGKLDGLIAQGSRGLAIDVDADLQKILIGSREITAVKGKLIKKFGSLLVRIKDLEARAYGGRLAGREVMIRMSDPPKYSFRLFYQNVGLGELVNAGVKKPSDRTDVRGLMEGKISLEATAGDPKSRRAAGTVVVSKGKMYKMPIVLGLMHVLYLSLPGDAAFTDGHLKYFVQGDTMVIEEIFLIGSALSLVGSGRMKMSTEELDLTFLTGPPGRLPRIAVIRNASKVLSAILKELLVIRVTGTLSKPVRKAVPLRSIDAILKELLSPGKVSR